MLNFFFSLLLFSFTYLQGETTIAVVGDSLLKGYPFGQEFSWINILRKDTHFEDIILKCCFDQDIQSPDCTFRLGNKYLDLLISQNDIPDIYIIALGFHDIGNDISREESYFNLQKTIDECKLLGIKVLLCNCDYTSSDFIKKVKPLSQILDFKDTIEIFQDNNPEVILFEYLDENLFNNPDLTTDGLHLNKKGQEILAIKMKEIILDNVQ